MGAAKIHKGPIAVRRYLVRNLNHVVNIQRSGCFRDVNVLWKNIFAARCIGDADYRYRLILESPNPNFFVLKHSFCIISD